MFSGHLKFEAVQRGDGSTAIGRQAFRAPFHIGKPYWDGQVLQVRIVNPTAGVLAGDELDLNIRVAANASLLATTPAATRAFVMRGGTATCTQRFAIERGAWLEYAPEPLFPHRDSDYTQRTRIDVEDGGEVVYGDALAPGRAGRGETWVWRRLQIALEVACGTDLVLRERLAFSGEELGRLAAFHGMKEAWFGTVVAVSPRLEAAGPLLDGIRALHTQGRWVGVTCLRPTVWMVRIVAPGSQSLRDALREIRTSLSGSLPGLKSDLRRL